MTRRCRSCRRDKALGDFPLQARGGRESCLRCSDIDALGRDPERLRALLAELQEHYATEVGLAVRLGFSVDSLSRWRKGRMPGPEARGVILDLAKWWAESLAARRPVRRTRRAA